VVNVGFAPGTRLTARPANLAVSGKYNTSDLAPPLVPLSHRIVECWLLQPELPGRDEPAIATRDQPEAPRRVAQEFATLWTHHDLLLADASDALQLVRDALQITSR
jgi:hypothetical protein